MNTTATAGRWVSLEVAAAHISSSRQTVYRLIDRGQIVAAKVGTRRLVDLDSLDAHLQRCRAIVAVPAGPEPNARACPPGPPEP